MYEKLNKYRIKERLVRGFVIASGIPAAVAAVALVVMVIVAMRYSNALKVYGFAQGDVGKAMTYFGEARSTLRGVIGYDDEAVIESLKASHTASIENFTASFEALEKAMVSEENKKVYADISSKLSAYWALDNEIIVQGGVTDREQCEIAQARAINELAPLYEDIKDDLIEIMDIKVDRGNSTSTMLTIACIVLGIAIAVIIIIAIFTSIRLGRHIAENISAPLSQLSGRLEQFAEGDLSTPFPETQSEDEVSDIIGSAKDMAETLMFVIYDLEYILGEMSNSNFVIRSKDSERYKGEFRQIFDSLKQLRDNMVDTLRYIGMSSEQVSAGSSNLADTSQSLAEGATEQAGAVQELHATITTISEAARRAADSAEDAYKQSQEYADVADRSSGDMKEMVEAMGRISEASHKIGNIISEIENIASETNMLSLNASIEAARAGEAGRGFAVVADEIGGLASQTSSTVSNINGITTEVNQAVGNMESCLQEILSFLEGTVLKDYSDFMGVAEKYTQDASDFEENMKAIGVEVESLLSAIVEIAESVNSITLIVVEAADNISSVAQKTQNVSQLVEGNAELMETNSENVVKLKNIVDMFHN